VTFHFVQLLSTASTVEREQMKDNKERSDGADRAAWRAHRSRDRTTTYRRSAGLAVLVAAAAVALAACGGSRSPSAASSATVASLPTSSGNGNGGSTATGGGSTTTAVPHGNPTKLTDEWATCMHSHGDPNQADPIIDAYGVINITIPGDGADSLSNEVHAGADPCNKYMAAAQSALRAAHPVAPPPDQSQQLKYVSCMRANGVPEYPYPTGTGNETNFNGAGVDPNSPVFMNANKVCGKQIGAPAWWISGTGPPGDVSVGNLLNGRPPPSSPTPNRPRPVPGGNGGAGDNSGSGAGG
jgi:hypothetical protein